MSTMDKYTYSGGLSVTGEVPDSCRVDAVRVSMKDIVNDVGKGWARYGAGKKLSAGGIWQEAKRPLSAPQRRRQSEVSISYIMKHCDREPFSMNMSREHPTPLLSTNTTEGILLKLLELVDYMDAPIETACAAFDFLITSGLVAKVFSPVWCQLLASIKAVLIKAVKADPPRHSAPFPEEHLTDTTKICRWVAARQTEYKSSTTWQDACLQGHSRDEVLGEACIRDLKKAQAERASKQKRSFLNAKWELFMRIILRQWRRYASHIAAGRAVSLRNHFNIQTRCIKQRTISCWRCYVFEKRHAISSVESRRAHNALAGIKQDYEDLRTLHLASEHVIKELKVSSDLLQYDHNELEKAYNNRTANKLLFDLSSPLADMEGTVMSSGIISFKRPDLTTSAVGVGETGQQSCGVEGDPDYYTVWVQRGVPIVKEEWTNAEVLRLWMNHVLTKALQSDMMQHMIPPSLRSHYNAMQSKAAHSRGKNAGVPEEYLVPTLADITVDVWMLLLSCVAQDALNFVCSTSEATPDKTELVWKALLLIEILEDADKTSFTENSQPLQVVILSKLLLYDLLHTAMDPDELAARAAASSSRPWYPKKTIVPPINIRCLISKKEVNNHAVCKSSTPSDAHLVLIWASGQLQAAQGGGYFRRTVKEKVPRVTDVITETLLTAQKGGTKRRATFVSKSPRLKAKSIIATEATSAMQLVWWHGASSWIEIDGKYKCATFATGFEPGLWKLVQLSQFVSAPYLTDGALNLPANTPNNEYEHAVYLLQCLKQICPGNSFPFTPGLLACNSPDVKMVFVTTLFLSCWMRKTKEEEALAAVPNARIRKKKKKIEEKVPVLYEAKSVMRFMLRMLPEQAREVTAESSSKIKWLFLVLCGMRIDAELPKTGVCAFVKYLRHAWEGATLPKIQDEQVGSCYDAVVNDNGAMDLSGFTMLLFKTSSLLAMDLETFLTGLPNMHQQYLSELYTPNGRDVLMKIGPYLSQFFIAHSTCPTPTNLLADRVMSFKTFEGILQTIGNKHSSLHTFSHPRTLTSLIHLVELTRSVPASYDFPQMCDTCVPTSPCPTSVLQHLSYDSFIDALFTVSVLAINCPWMANLVRFEHFTVFMMQPCYEEKMSGLLCV